MAAKGSSNPFHDSDDEDGGGGEDKGAAAGSSNPFDFDVDFNKVQRRRERARAEKEKKKEEAEKAIMPGMDTDEPIESGSESSESSEGSEEAPQSNVRRHNIITYQKAMANDYQREKDKKNNFGFLNMKKKDLDEVPEEQPYEISLEPVLVGKKRLAIWPYDDYHLLQMIYYEKLEEAARDDRSEKKESQEVQSSVPIFSRPPDPPDITAAVQGLSLTEFERKAQERAIAIISTWLFDAGLIDELLVHGGMNAWAIQSTAYPDDKSVQTSEGIEVGQSGYPIEGSSKMDKEIAKLRNSTTRQLALINARLNDGVAATGSEVKELVQAVSTTKDEIGRLRELSTYVSNTNDVDQANQFMLTKYPKLKQAINARRNLARCFRELEFFGSIPSTCDRLREDLQSCEWTAHEWSTLRAVCREHVDLEIFLVEAEAGMKKRLEEEESAVVDDKQRHKKKTQKGKANKFGRRSLTDVGIRSDNKEIIDRFLEEHVNNVWELGDEIRMRIMSGIATAFDLAINNPAGMVALVEAVEVYQSAEGDYKAVHGEAVGDGHSLRFTDMRAAALGELYKDFEARGTDVFREITMQAADVADEVEAANRKFSAVLRAANELAAEISVVKEHVAPCFPPEWAIATLWTTCVAHVCSGNILQQIGGPEGHKLPDLTVTQLLDLVAWVETFREIIEETFPDITKIKTKRTYFDNAPTLLVDNNKKVDIEVAKDSLAWVNNTLWEVHDLAKDEFLFRTKEQTEEWLENVYKADHTKSQRAEGRLVTSLCEDVYSLAGVQLRTIRERLTRRSEALVQAVGVIFKNLYEKQMNERDRFCTDFETCCAAANDFVRMSEKCEEVVGEIQDECQLAPHARETLDEQAAALLGLYSSDAVYATKKTHVYCFEPIEENIFEDMFSPTWLDDLTHNELALTLVRTLEDFMLDLERFLDYVMLVKAVEAQVTSSVNFYIKCLLCKSGSHKDNKKSYFTSNEKALTRMRGDISIIREYFEEMSGNMPTLKRAVETEFDTLEAVLELISIAAGISKSDAQDFIMLLHKKIKNLELTKYAVGDIWHLVKPSEEYKVYEIVDSMEDTLRAISGEEKPLAKDRNIVPGLRLDHIIAEHLGNCERNRPLKGSAVDQAQKALQGFRFGFGGGKEKGDKGGKEKADKVVASLADEL